MDKDMAEKTEDELQPIGKSGIKATDGRSERIQQWSVFRWLDRDVQRQAERFTHQPGGDAAGFSPERARTNGIGDTAGTEQLIGI